MPSVLGCDLSSRAVDLVLLDENTAHAEVLRLELPGRTAWERLLAVRDVMPSTGWYDHHGVYLVAIEMPESRHTQSLRAQLPIVGAVVAALPPGLRRGCWQARPDEWKQPLGLPRNAKPTVADFPAFDVAGWGQDALDALGVACWARDLNAGAIALALSVVGEMSVGRSHGFQS